MEDRVLRTDLLCGKVNGATFLVLFGFVSFFPPKRRLQPSKSRLTFQRQEIIGKIQAHTVSYRTARTYTVGRRGERGGGGGEGLKRGRERK